MTMGSTGGADLTALPAALGGRYRLGRELGAGGMATVWLAEDLRHGREVALKVLRPDVAGALGRERFLREIQLAARLAHPHILPLYDSGDAGGVLYFTMPVMEGQTLRERLAREPRLPVDEALRIAGQVADALDYAHRQGVVHRDIKPENILLHEGHAVVADFGIGKALAAAAGDTAACTQVGLLVGTPTYMSPEQAAGEELDGRSDLFALGCVLYEMLVGEVAFGGPTVQAIIARRFMHTPAPVSAQRTDVPPAVTRLVARLLERAVAERFATGAEVVAALRTPFPASDAAVPPPQAHAERSVAVLPFTNLSTDAENEFFSDGLTEEIITDLSRVGALRVISRASSMRFKGTTARLHAIGEELGVRYVLTGSVRKAGSALRISAQLVDVRTDEPVWAEKYSGTMDEVFDVQERVSRAIVAALDVALSPTESARLRDRPIGDARAFELFVQARDALRSYDITRAMPLIARAVEIEGDVPVLRALRAMASVILLRIGGSQEPAALIAEIEREAQALVESAPDRPYGNALRGFAAFERGDLPAAVRALRRAMELDPADDDVRFFLGLSLHASDQVSDREALSWLALDPLSALTNALVGSNAWFQGRAAEGVPFMEESVRLAPDGLIFRWALGYHYALVGRGEDAAVQAAWLTERAPQVPYTSQLRALIAALEGRAADALTLLETVDIGALDGHHTFHVAESYIMAGEGSRGLALLDTAVDRGFYPYGYYAHYCPFLAPVRGTAEFGRIAAKAAARVAAFDA
jgi:eukaryotic-like serine/threonine-protein kinase